MEGNEWADELASEWGQTNELLLHSFAPIRLPQFFPKWDAHRRNNLQRQTEAGNMIFDSDQYLAWAAIQEAACAIKRFVSK